MSDNSTRCDAFIDFGGNDCMYLPLNLKDQLKRRTLLLQEIQFLGQGH